MSGQAGLCWESGAGAGVLVSAAAVGGVAGGVRAGAVVGVDDAVPFASGCGELGGSLGAQAANTTAPSSAQILQKALILIFLPSFRTHSLRTRGSGKPYSSGTAACIWSAVQLEPPPGGSSPSYSRAGTRCKSTNPTSRVVGQSSFEGHREEGSDGAGDRLAYPNPSAARVGRKGNRGKACDVQVKACCRIRWNTPSVPARRSSKDARRHSRAWRVDPLYC